MGNFVFNRSKGRGIEFCERVNGNDPTTAELNIRILRAASIEADDTLNNADTFDGVVSGTTDYATNSGYAEKVISDGAITLTYDDTANTVTADIADQTWTAVGSGDVWSDLIIGYDGPGAGTGSQIIPMTQHDFSVTPDGSDITAQIANFLSIS